MFNSKERSLFLISILAAFIVILFSTTLTASNASFRLTSSRIFSEGEKTYIRLSSYRAEEIEFKVYRINDPFEFFQSQSDVHYIKRPTLREGETGLEKMSGFEKKFAEWRRDFFSSKKRMKIIELLGEKEVEEEEEGKASEQGKMEIRETKEEKKKTFKQIPFLNDKNLVQKWTEKISGSSDRWQYQDVEIQGEGKSEAGVYLIEASYENTFAYTVLIVTDIAMVIKQGPEKFLTYVVDRETGEPIDGAEVVVMKGGKELKKGKTKSDGLMLYEKKSTTKGSQEYITMAKNKEHFAIADPYYWYSSYSDGYKVYTYTERPVYRPNQTVHFKSVVRKMTRGQYENAANVTASLVIRDSRGSEMYSNDELVTNEFGSFADSFGLAEEPPIGRYEIEVRIGDNYYWGDFQVKEYKKPEYKVTVTTDEKNYVFGEQIDAKVKAEYYFGAPVQEAKVRYYIYRSRYWVPWWYWYDTDYSWYFEDDDESYYYYDSEFIDEGEGTLDKDGNFNFTVYTDIEDYDENSIYRIEATVEDKSRREIVGSKSVKVTVGEYFLSTYSNKYVYKPGEDVTVTVRSMDFNNEPVSASGKVNLIKRDWRNSNYKETYIGEYDFSTTKGKGTVNLKVSEAGYYRIEAVSYDKRNRKVVATDYIYVNEKGSRYYFYSDGVQIIPDKNSYDVGDLAHIMVIAPAENVNALVTIEGEEIQDYSVVSVEGNSFIIDLPIEEKYAPNTFVKVSIVQGNQIYQQEKMVIVPPTTKFLDITVTSDKEKYEPQEVGTFTVEAKDADGKPVDAEISLGIVDESIYYIAKENVEDIRKYFYNKRWNRVYTTSSFYFSFYGYSREEEMAELKKQNEAAERDAFADFKGGKKMQEARIRKDFRDMIFWSPTIRTGSDGKEVIKVKYPDNLTSWRATARAITKDTKVGSVTQNTITKQDLICRLETPRFFTQGDIVTLSTIVHNYLDTEKECQVSLKIKGDNVQLMTGENQKTIFIPPNSEKRLDWIVEATEVGDVEIIGEALTNEKSDAMQLTIPVLPWGQYQGSAIAGELKDQKQTITENIYIPEEAIDGTISMRLSLSPTLATTMLTSLEYLIGFPYGCTEQTMSRFLPDVLVADILRDLGMENDKIMEQLPEMVEAGLQRLTNYQHYDGGWGWWENDESNPFMTAYVVYGLAKARDAGFKPSDYMIEQGVYWLQENIENTEIDEVTRAYMVYAIATAEKAKEKNSTIEYVEEFGRRKSLDSYAQALLCLALHEVGEKEKAAKYVAQLEQQKIVEGPNCYWGGTGQEALVHWQDDRLEITATAVRAISKIQPNSEYLFSAVRWLMMNRQGNRWKSTKDTATVLYAMVDFLKSRGELNPDYKMSVYVNDEKIKELSVKDKKSVQELSNDIILESDKIKVGANNKIRIEKEGTGVLYYSSYTNFYNQADYISPTAHGISISRKYYKLVPVRGKGGSWVYAKYLLTEGDAVKSGAPIMVELKLNPNQSYEYVMLEDPLPSGCEVIEDDKRYPILGEEDDHDDYWYDWGWAYWYSQREFRDEKATFFMEEVWGDEQTITYILRAEKPGYYRVMPAKIELMYMPEVGGNSSGFEFEITD